MSRLHHVARGWWLCFGIGLGLVGCAHSASTPPEQSNRTQEVAQRSVSAAASPEMQALAFMMGRWKVAESFDPGPMGAGGSGEGEMTAVLGPGGRSIIVDYRTTRGPMQGFGMHEIITWDPEQKAYQLAFVSNRGGVEVSRGAAGEGQFVFDREAKRHGQTFISRGLILDIASSSFAMESHLGSPEGQFKRMMRLEFTK